jgi:hypothetical protein
MGACSSGTTSVGDRVRALTTATCRRAWRLYDMSTAGIGNAVHAPTIPGLPLYIDPLSALGPSGGPDMQAYLNRPDVRAALHTSQSPNAVYHIELDNNGYPQYGLQYSACNDHATTEMPSMVDVYRQLIGAVAEQRAPSLQQIVISSGDLDPVVDMHGTEEAVNRIGLEVASGNPRRPWFYNASGVSAGVIATTPISWGASKYAHDAGPQVGGFVTSYETGVPSLSLSFVLVRNAGHMVPAYAPQKALHVLHRLLIEGELLAPPLPTGWESSSGFYARNGTAPGIFAEWVTAAMAKPFVL